MHTKNIIQQCIDVITAQLMYTSGFQVYKEIPLFQGIKSSWPCLIAFTIISPLGTVFTPLL
jgi:hypothetical protein